jgi:hypothetical protein
MLREAHMKYKIYAALAEEENEGWVWFKTPKLNTRTLVKLHSSKTRRTVFCQSRKIDDNFLKRYNECPRIRIQNGKEEPLVIGEWYRDALGGFDTQTEVDVEISPLKIPLWRELRAACHHPDIVARIGTRLGILGAWLGIIGIAIACWDLIDADKCVKAILEFLVITIITIFSIAAGRGVHDGTKP